MRIAGWILLLIGLLLCISVDWAAVGFLSMGAGLIALQVAEQRRRRVRHAVAVDAEGFHMPLPALTPARMEAPVVHREPVPGPALEVVRRAEPAKAQLDRPAAAKPVAAKIVSARSAAIRSAAAQHVLAKPAPDKPGLAKPAPAKSSYDKEAWHHLVERDPDLAQLASVLADYGQSYVDELATRYLAAPDKSRLGEIVDGIIAKAIGNVLAVTKPPTASTQAPEVAISRNDPEPDAAPASTPPLTEMEVSVIAAIAAAPAPVAAEPAPVDPPEPVRENGHTAITAADDELSEMIRKFTPTSSFLREG